MQIRIVSGVNDKRKVGYDNTDLTTEPAIIPEEQPITPQGTTRLEHPSVLLSSSFIP